MALAEIDRIGPQACDYDWYVDLTGRPLIVVASGPSARNVDLTIARDRAYVIAVNESWKLCPWADMLYACDAQWWYKRRHDWKAFNGLKVSQDRCTAELLIGEDIKRVIAVKGADHVLFGQPGYIGWFGNSGTQAINLGGHFNPSKIILVGFDMSLDNGGHWHGRHANGLHNPKSSHVQRWRRATEHTFHALAREGIAGINASAETSLIEWPRMTLSEALDV